MQSKAKHQASPPAKRAEMRVPTSKAGHPGASLSPSHFLARKVRELRTRVEVHVNVVAVTVFCNGCGDSRTRRWRIVRECSTRSPS